MDTDFHKIYTNNNEYQINQDSEIIIGDKCWIGCRSLILKGVTIPNNAIIAANSTVVNS